MTVIRKKIENTVTATTENNSCKNLILNFTHRILNFTHLINSYIQCTNSFKSVFFKEVTTVVYILTDRSQLFSYIFV